MTFNEIYDGFMKLYLDAEEKQREGCESDDVRLIYWCLVDFYTTLLRFERNREYTSVVERTINDFDLNDAEKVKKLCTLFYITPESVNAKVLIYAVETIRKQSNNGN